jgi:hypothetical protein
MVMLQPHGLGSRGLLGATTRSRRHATQRKLDHQKDSVVAAVVLALDRRKNWNEIDLPFIVSLTERIMGQTPERKRSISR